MIPLAKQGAVSQKEPDDSIQANASNKASVFAAKAHLDKAKLSLDWTNIASPVDGVAGIASAQIGDLVMENIVLTTVSQVDPTKVLFPISEKMYLRFAQRAAANPAADRPNPIELKRILADGTVYPRKGKVALPDRQVDVKTGTITMVGYFPNPGNVLRPGQYAKVRAVIETLHDVLLVPQRAVQDQEKVAAEGVSPVVIFGFSLLFVFLILAAQYESWALPVSVLLATPISVFGAFAALSAVGLEQDVYSQIGLVMLIGLSAKNAILIVEFARPEVEKGRSIMEAAVAGARLRLRPILMTALAFILGVLPLVLSSGAGAHARAILGFTVLGDMLAASLLAITVIPVCYYFVERWMPARKARPSAIMPVLTEEPVRGGG